MIAVVKPFRVK